MSLFINNRCWWAAVMLVGVAGMLAVGSADAVVRHRRRHAVVHHTVAPPPDEAVLAMEKSLPQNQGLPPLPVLIVSESGFLERGTVEVLLGLGDHNPQWQLSQTMLQVLPKELAVISGKTARLPTPEDGLIQTVKNVDSTYRGLRLRLIRSDGKGYQPLLVAQGKLRAPGGVTVAADPGRRLEYWLFSTARIRRDLLLASQVLPVMTFEQCRVLGNSIVETTPRQCLLPDQNILLETSDPLTKSSLAAKDYDTCLRYGESLIYSYPRRCLAAGGRVYTEPPRLDASDVSGDILAPDMDNPLNLPKPMGTQLPDAATGPGSPVGDLGTAAPVVSATVVVPTALSSTTPSWLPAHKTSGTAVVKPKVAPNGLPELRPGVPWPVWPSSSVPGVVSASNPAPAGAIPTPMPGVPLGGLHGMLPTSPSAPAIRK